MGKDKISYVINLTGANGHKPEFDGKRTHVNDVLTAYNTSYSEEHEGRT